MQWLVRLALQILMSVIRSCTAWLQVLVERIMLLSTLPEIRFGQRQV